MIKLLGIITVFFAASAIGITLSKKLKDRIAILNLIKLMLEELSIQIRFRHLTVSELVYELSSNERIKKLEFLNEINTKLACNHNFKFVWRETVEGWSSNLMKHADIEMLSGIGDFLGSSDTDGQLSSIEIYSHNTDVLISEAVYDYEKKGKLYRSLGILSGAFIAIMLL